MGGQRERNQNHPSAILGSKIFMVVYKNHN